METRETSGFSTDSLTGGPERDDCRKPDHRIGIARKDVGWIQRIAEDGRGIRWLLTKQIGEISPTCLISIENHQKRP